MQLGGCKMQRKLLTWVCVLFVVVLFFTNVGSLFMGLHDLFCTALIAGVSIIVFLLILFLYKLFVK